MIQTIDFAPLDGITKIVFRQVWSQFFGGVDRYFIPFFSPTPHHLMTPRDLREVDYIHNANLPSVPQVMTKNADDFLWACEVLKDMGYTEVNLNLGCPSGTVTAKGKGSGFLAHPNELAAFFDEVFSKNPLPVSVKTRLGYETPEEFAALLDLYNRYPIACLTVHPRVRKEKYRGPVHLDAFADALANSRNPVCYNGDLITDAMLWKVMQNKEGLTVDADHVVAITNGGGIRAAIKPGDVTKKDINTVLPFGNTVAVIYVTGAELLEALEASTYSLPVGGFPQVAGINFTLSTAVAYDANAETYPASTYYGPKSINRVVINSINGKEFKADDTYAVVTNNFVAGGGDTYYAFAAASAQFDTGIPLDEAVMEYVTTELKGVIGAQYAAPQGRILLNPFKDVKVSSWFGKYVIDLYNDGIINGTSATTYAPNDTLTWAAALKLLLVSNGDLKAADATGADWSKNVIAKAAELGLVAADLDGAKAISRLEFCQVAAKLNKLAESKTESKFTDCTDGYVMALVDAKVINGMTETTFEPDASLTRAQIAKIIYQLNLIEK